MTPYHLSQPARRASLRLALLFGVLALFALGGLVGCAGATGYVATPSPVVVTPTATPAASTLSSSQSGTTGVQVEAWGPDDLEPSQILALLAILVLVIFILILLIRRRRLRAQKNATARLWEEGSPEAVEEDA